MDPHRGSAEVVLHIGTPKTGTSVLQNACHSHADLLAQQGIFYPSQAGTRRHYKLSLYVTPEAELEQTWRWKHGNFRDHRTFRRNLRTKLTREVRRSGCDRVLLSDEALYAKRPEELRDLLALLSRFSDAQRVIVYLRRQDDHVVSRYQQQVKQGLTLRLADYVEQVPTATYDYFAQLDRWRRTIDPEEFTVRRYEPGSFHGGTLHADFFAAVGAVLDPDELGEPEPRNESVDADTVEFLRLLNSYRVEYEGETPGVIDNRGWLARTASRARGATLTLPDAQLDHFMDQWRGSNDRVAREFLGDEGGLFAAPRGNPHARTEQRIEAPVLEEFLELAEVPNSWRDGVRAIWARDQRSG